MNHVSVACAHFVVAPSIRRTCNGPSSARSSFRTWISRPPSCPPHHPPHAGSRSAHRASHQEQHPKQATQAAVATSMSTSAAAAGVKHEAASSNARTAVVVGAGPAGCLVALLLAKQGWRVHVMEMRDRDSSVGSQSKLRSWAIALYSRGINAIKKAVPDAGDFFRSRAYEALVINRADGSVSWSMQRKQSGTALVHRTEVAALLTEAMQQHSDLITIHYGARFTGADFDAKTARFQLGAAPKPGPHAPATPAPDATDRLELAYELLVGADGAASAVRASLVQAFPSSISVDMVCPSDGRVYKAFHGLPKDPQALLWNPGHAGTDAEAAAGLKDGHWPAAGRPSDPGICFNVFASQRPGVGISASYDASRGTYSGFFPMLEHLLPTPVDSEEAWFAWLDAVAFPPLPRSWHRQLAAQLAQAPISRIPNVQRTTSFTVPGTGAVLIGDAAHTVTPALGQGINSALEDAVLLADALERCDGDGGGSGGGVDAALGGFSRSRMPQIAAMQVLELSMRLMSTPLFEGTRLGKLIARLRGVPSEHSLFGVTNSSLWLRARFTLYFIGKLAIATTLQAALGRRRAHAWLPWLFKGPPMIEVQVGEVDYVTMVRLLNIYGLAMTGAGVGVVALVYFMLRAQ